MMINKYEIPEESIEFQIDRAERAISKIENEEVKAWLSCILDVLKMRNYVRVKELSGDLVDVESIAYTYGFASFFDVYNHIELFDISIQPLYIEELQYTLKQNNY